MEVGIIGSGRLGGSLHTLLTRCGYVVDLAGRGRIPAGEVILLCVPDAAIPTVGATVPASRVLLHCSGTTPFEVLRPHPCCGSFHPLMTFPGPHALPDLTDVPAALDGDPAALVAARALCDALGMVPLTVPGDRRLYHAAAVVSGNFATVLLAEASRILAAAGVPADQAPALLAPLAMQSIRNAVAVGPAASLTGPVPRGDGQTLDGHRAALDAAGLADVTPLYDLLVERAQALSRGES